MTPRGFEFLPCTWETGKEFLAPVSAWSRPDCSGYLESKQTGGRFPSVCFSAFQIKENK